MGPVVVIIGRFLLGILGLILLFMLLMCFSLRLRISLISGKLSVSAHYLFLRYRILPAKEKPVRNKRRKKKKPEREDDKDNKADKDKGEKPKEKRSLKSLYRQYLPLLRTARKTVRRLCKRIVIYNVEAGIDVGGDDAHKAAISYAKAASFAAILRELMGEIFTLRIKYLRISPDFLHGGVSAGFSLRIRFRPIFAAAAAVHLLFAFLKTQVKYKGRKKKKRKNRNKNINKGGRKYESASHR